MLIENYQINLKAFVKMFSNVSRHSLKSTSNSQLSQTGMNNLLEN